MREGITIEVSAADRARLEAVVADRNSSQKHVWRAEIILATAGLRAGGHDLTVAEGLLKEMLARLDALLAHRRAILADIAAKRDKPLLP